MSQTSSASEPIYKTIARFRQQFPGVEKKRYNSYNQSHYASFDDVWRVVEPHLEKAGLWVEQHVGNGMLTITLVNKDGNTLSSQVELPPSTDQFQKFGSALTYYRRYLICVMLNVTEADQDDDGVAGDIPSTANPINDTQLSAIYDLIAETGTDQRRLVEYIEQAYGVSKIEELNYSQAAVVRRMLAERLQKLKEKQREAEHG